jgi:uncharacterized membrane protein YgcG
VGSLFSKVFGNWIDGIINVCLWRFWWMVILLCMYTRIEWLMDMGQYDPYCQWEMIMFTAFGIILVYVPFIPFEFRPGDMVDKISQKAQEGSSHAVQSGGGGSGGGGSGGGGGGGGRGGANGSTSGAGGYKGGNVKTSEGRHVTANPKSCGKPPLQCGPNTQVGPYKKPSPSI